MNATRLNTQLLLQRSVDFNQNLSAKFLGLNRIFAHPRPPRLCLPPPVRARFLGLSFEGIVPPSFHAPAPTPGHPKTSQADGFA